MSLEGTWLNVSAALQMKKECHVPKHTSHVNALGQTEDREQSPGLMCAFTLRHTPALSGLLELSNICVPAEDFCLSHISKVFQLAQTHGQAHTVLQSWDANVFFSGK